MQTSHKLTRIFVALFALIVLAAAAMAQNPADIAISDQQAGSLLVYPFYTSDSQTKADTRITLSNVHTEHIVAVHLFFMDRSCNQADTYVCLTPNASISLKASEFDPDTKGGWLLAVAVTRMGIPYTISNSLIGNAFVVDGDYVGNYGAEAVRSYVPELDAMGNVITPAVATTTDTATVRFLAPDQFAAEIQSPNDAVGQRIVTVGLSGSLMDMSVKGAGQVGIGQLYNGNEKPFGSFSKFLADGCRSEAIITTTFPRVPLGLGVLIPSGQIGTLKWNSGPSVGLIMTPKTAKWSGIRTLHKTRQTATRLTIPVFNPGGCGLNP